MASPRTSPPISTISLQPAYSPGLNDQPKGGILLNGDASSRRLSEPSSPRTPRLVIPPGSPGQSPGPPSASSGKAGSSSAPRIRFAPLPEATRPRSLSTGNNIAWTAGVDENGNETRHMEVRNIPQSAVSYDYDEAVDDDDEDGGGRDKRGRSWSKSLDSSWKISKKILTAGMLSDEKEKKVDYGGGAPLKKSVSTGGMIGSSPFRWSSVDDRKRSMQGLAPSPSTKDHRRQSSFEAAAAASIAPGSSSAAASKVKMLNGRVYGARRASEIPTTGNKEPDFVEWGHAGSNSNVKSVMGEAVSAGGGRSLLGDEDGGSGMEWVKRRREERQRKKEEEERKALEEAERAAAGQAAEDNPEAPKLSSSQSSQEGFQAVTPGVKTADLPTTPIIHISEPMSPGVSMPDTQPIALGKDVGQMNPDPFGEPAVSEGEEEDDDDGDFSSDDEEEEEFDRSTAAAAGIEVVARHHH